MGHTIIICEKPSVSQEYKKVLQVQSKGKADGYIQGYSPVLGKEMVITWCVGHLCTLSYPEVYNPDLKNWKLETLPFLPTEYKYEVIPAMRKQFGIVKKLYHDKDLDAIYYAGDSAREGIYIQALVRQMAGHKSGIAERVVWIDSQTEAEILRGIREAKDITAYQDKINAAYMRAIEDYAVGINFSRALSCKYGKAFQSHCGSEKWTISVGRVMSCVLGMVVSREREIRNFVETPFYKIAANTGFDTEWKADERSAYFGSPFLHNESGFKDKEKAQFLLATLSKTPVLTVQKIKLTEERKKAPLLYNLAEIQFDCSKRYKISPDETLAVIQSLYEKKLVTYPRTDARVLSSAVAGEIATNLNGLVKLGYKKDMTLLIAKNGWHKKLLNSPYVDDSKISDHYAIIPTENIGEADKLSEMETKIYHDIIDRFLCIFYPPAVYLKGEVILSHTMQERFYGSIKTLSEYGFLAVLDDKTEKTKNPLQGITEGQELPAIFAVKEGKTTPPKRYTSGSMVLAMENAGKMIEDEELREQIKGCGIGTSATRAEIIKKLVKIGYLKLNTKTQVLTPELSGETVYDILLGSIPALLKPEMTANWEKGLDGVDKGTVPAAVYRDKIEQYVRYEIGKIKAGQDITYSTEKAQETENVKLMCPKCGKGYIFQGKKVYGCSEYKNGCNFMIPKEISKKSITPSMVAKLVEGKPTGKLKGFKKKDGTEFSAALELDASWKLQFAKRR